MKRYFILLLLVMPIFAFTPIQPEKVAIGLAGGMNFSNPWGNIDGKISGAAQVNAGMIFDVQLSERLSIRAEPMYIQKGAQIDLREDDLRMELTVHYIELPLCLTYNFGPDAPYLLAGPTIAYQIDSEITTELMGLNFRGDLNRVLHDFDLGFTIGAGMKLLMEPVTIFLESRYTVGLKNQVHSGQFDLEYGTLSVNADVDAGDEIKYRGWQVLAGITIPVSF